MENEQKWPEHLVLVRHGESTRNLERETARHSGELVYGGDVRDPDVRLSERGNEQAIFAGQDLAQNFTFDVVFASPYRRTRDTARLMIEQFPGTPKSILLEERIREIEFGILDGLTRKGLQVRYPDEWKRKQHLGKYYYRPPGGESYPDVALRLHSFLGTLTREYRRKSVLVVTHSVVVLLFRRLLERLSEQKVLEIDRDPKLEIWNCSITHYACDHGARASGKFALQAFNRIPYPRRLASKEMPHSQEPE